MAIPKKKMLSGITRWGDVYVTPRGITWIYRGIKKEHWNKSKYWEKVDLSKIRSRDFKRLKLKKMMK